MVSLEKPAFKFVSGYRNDLIDGTRNFMTTCFSQLNRYEEQIGAIAEKMKNHREGALKVFNVGISQGQEPLTHINSACKLIKGTDRSIPNVLDLSMVDILLETPIAKGVEQYVDPKAIEYLRNLYRMPDKTHFETPFEKLAAEMLKQGQKQDVVLFNNVIQHMNFNDEKAALESIKNLIDLVKKDGLFCFTCEPYVAENPMISKRCAAVLKMLKDNGFAKTAEGIYKKIT